MEDKTLLKMAIVISLVGISILFILSNEISVDESMLSKITSTDSAVTVKGSVLKIMNFTNSRIVQLEKKEKVDIVLIGKDYLELNKGDSVEVIGSWDDKTPGNLSMLAKEIRKI